VIKGRQGGSREVVLEVPTDLEEWPIELQYRWLWLQEARPGQIPPKGDWFVWFLMGGRGSGKTRAGAEYWADYALTLKDRRIAIIARTLDDVRDTCVEGESGLERVIPSRRILKWNRSQGDLFLTNGTKFSGFSSQVPESLRGPQHHGAWVEELAAWVYVQGTWDMMLLGLRLGDRPHVVVTSTPKPLRLIKELTKRPDVVVTRESTYANLANLAPTVSREILSMYEGTRLGRQELHGEILDDAPGAMWRRQQLEDYRLAIPISQMDRIVVGVDPAVTSGEESHETGIVVVGRVNRDCPCGHLPDLPHGFILEDATIKAPPNGWARAAVTAYDKYEGDRIVGEVNNGGDLVETVVRTVSPSVSYKSVHATRGKKKRAEPVASLYEQGRMHHAGAFPDLEDQQCTWEPGEDEGDSDVGGFSPDRVDAMVWAVTDLMLGPRGRRLRHRE
jgi:phage terminase large subunit-like protein